MPAPVTDIAAADLDAMLRVNLFGALFVMQEAVPLMLAQGGGSIVNVASLAGRRGVTPLGGYCATKFALIGLTLEKLAALAPGVADAIAGWAKTTSHWLSTTLRRERR